MLCSQFLPFNGTNPAPWHTPAKQQSLTSQHWPHSIPRAERAVQARCVSLYLLHNTVFGGDTCTSNAHPDIPPPLLASAVLLLLQSGHNLQKMPLRDLLKKKEKIEEQVDRPAQAASLNLPQASEFTFMRTDTHTEEVIAPPSFANERSPSPPKEKSKSPRRSLNAFRKSRDASPADGSPPQKEHKRLSQRFGIHRDRSVSSSSVNIPQDLPEIDNAYSDNADREETEAKWEERATRLANASPKPGARPRTPDVSNLNLGEAASRPNLSRTRSISDAASDVNIQEAIRLHEEGSLEAATNMFSKLAERGNVLSQVLYGLSLRHGWGCTPDPERAVTYLAQAAANSAEIESQALQAGMKKGGAAKGELVLAIFELANCYRHGWGIAIDKAAARQYYETAANLGDTDAMNEAAWCYLEGFGGKKDKVSMAHLSTMFANSAAAQNQCIVLTQSTPMTSDATTNIPHT